MPTKKNVKPKTKTVKKGAPRNAKVPAKKIAAKKRTARAKKAD